jgi:hypothetical protein
LLFDISEYSPSLFITTKKWQLFDVLKPWSKKPRQNFLTWQKLKRVIMNFFDVLNSATSKNFDGTVQNVKKCFFFSSLLSKKSKNKCVKFFL